MRRLLFTKEQQFILEADKIEMSPEDFEIPEEQRNDTESKVNA